MIFFLTGNSEDDNYDDEKDNKLMPPPSWLPPASKLEGESEVKVSPGKPREGSDKTPYVAPLAAMLPPELAKVDATKLFPEFRPGEVRKHM